MSITRLTQNICLNEGERFIIFYGRKVNDKFCDDDLQYRPIDYMLWRHLKNQGYQRIVFFSSTSKISFLDDESKQLCRPNKEQKTPSGGESLKSSSELRQQGPLGKRRLLMGKAAGFGSVQESVSQSSPGRATTIKDDNPQQQKRMHDLPALEILNFIIRSERRIPTAIIFTHADYLKSSNFEGFKEIQGRMIDWAQMPDSRNICMLIFQSPTLEELRKKIEQNDLAVLSNYLSMKENQKHNVIKIIGPEPQEIINLIHRHRIQRGMKVDWMRLNRFAEWMAGENQLLSKWNARFQGVDDLTVAVVNKWLPAEREYSDKSAQERLDELICLNAVKEQIRRKIAVIGELDSDSIGTLHMAFLGNPGTGKTIVARLIGAIYREWGILKRGHTIKAENRDALVGQFEGQTAPRVNDLINQALNGVLFIDEAHALIRDGGADPFGTEAVKTLVARMETERDRLCVILAGYPNGIRRLIASDSGLKSRFGGNEILFEDYTPDELLEIFILIADTAKANAAKKGKSYPSFMEETLDAVSTIIRGMYETRNKEDWGNGRVMRTFFGEIIEQWALRNHSLSGKEKDYIIRLEDIPSKYKDYLEVDVNVANLLLEIDGLTGIQPVKDMIRNLVTEIQMKKVRKEEGSKKTPEPPMRHMLFSGSPGTGKTTVAKLMGRIFKGLGILHKGHVVETTPADLVGSHVGEGLDKLKDKVQEALGGILFIDEIYGLNEGSLRETYGKDVISSVIVPAMVQHKSNLIIIGAGYSEKINAFLKSNDGLERRFADIIEFQDFNVPELITILKDFAEKQGGYQLSADAEELMVNALIIVVTNKDKSFGNAGDMEKYFREMKRNLDSRLMKMHEQGIEPTQEELYTLTREDTPEKLKILLPATTVIDSATIIEELSAFIPKNRSGING